MSRAGNEKLGGNALNIPAAAGEKLKMCTIAAVNAAGYAEAGGKETNALCAGRVEADCDNRNGADGAAWVQVRRGVFIWNNDGTIKVTDILKTCYVAGPDTVTMTEEGHVAAGTIIAVDDGGVAVRME